MRDHTAPRHGRGVHEPPGAARYRICVRGVVGETVLSAFRGLEAHTEGGKTVLVGTLPDQPALYGVIAQIEALGLELLEVSRT